MLKKCPNRAEKTQHQSTSFKRKHSQIILIDHIRLMRNSVTNINQTLLKLMMLFKNKLQQLMPSTKLRDNITMKSI
ncbi:hypothetical protein A979_18890 [Pseudomonas syringae BRIP34876]|nr:hypothetical protein A979_18890 [Pseudomonas syringae BRIP34876]ELQ01270.1 hypothetical protein A987_14907 [Pseudomonas syringae BRIP34881]OBS35661.1 hypothetical protein A9K81_06635 [Pseudomonas syringae pv. syringae]PBQ09548.1 hypothetical protein CCL23_12315 [Pseudomonas syringae]